MTCAIYIAFFSPTPRHLSSSSFPISLWLTPSSFTQSARISMTIYLWCIQKVTKSLSPSLQFHQCSIEFHPCMLLGGDVVANTQHHSTCKELRNLPHVVVRLAIPHIAIVVVTTADASCALWRRLFKSRLFLPLAVICSTSIRIVVLRQSAIALGLHVLRFHPVVFTTLLWFLRQDCNVMPWSWVPIWIVVPLLRAFQAMSLLATTTAIAIGILTSGSCATVLLNLLICGKETLVALTFNTLGPTQMPAKCKKTCKLHGV